MRSALIDDSLWFIHKDGGCFYPWFRYSKHHRLRSFWVSDGSNLIQDATPVATVPELVTEVFSRGRSVWLFDGGKRGGLYRFGHDAIRKWDATQAVATLALRAGAPALADRRGG
ncbi:hypothetical protein [Luteimonas sp. MC1828]|uniref:hypothetical protein n=1 Tax=Luteimonas sp. MC1828 TaxID=2799787 RepID=UPI0018F1AFA1|nr:hypothetical protein [Luteimonas sp. MC1828]MBJ7574544.1 hypothetical protein [Luteimonas sp. MC1828]